MMCAKCKKPINPVVETYYETPARPGKYYHISCEVSKLHTFIRWLVQRLG